MTDPVKFTFDQAFDGGAKNRYDLEIERIREESEAAKVSVHTQGVEQGRQQALTEIEATTQEVLAVINQSAQALFTQHAQLEDGLRKQAVQLAFSIAAKLSPALIEQQPSTEVEALIEECLTTAQRQPQLVVKVSEALYEAINARIDQLKEQADFSGDILLKIDPSFGTQDCHVGWPDGGTERNYDAIHSEIADVIHRFLNPENDQASDTSMNGVDHTASPDQHIQE